MKKFKGFLGILLSVAMTVGLCSCGGANSENGGGSNNGGASAEVNSNAAKEKVYACNSIDIPEMGEDMSVMTVQLDGDRVKMLVQVYDYANYSENDIRIVSFNRDGSDVNSVKLDIPELENSNSDSPILYDDIAVEEAIVVTEDDAPVEDYDADEDYVEQDYYEYSYLGNYVFANDGYIYAMKSHYIEDYSDPDNYIYKCDYTICIWNEQGELVCETESMERADEYVVSLYKAKESGIVLAFYSAESAYTMTLNKDGVFSDKKDIVNGKDILNNINSSMYSIDGELFITHYDDTWTNLYLSNYDIEADKIVSSEKIPEKIAWNSYGMSMCENGDILYITSLGINKFNVKTQSDEEIMSYINSDLDTSSMNMVVQLSDDSFVGFYYSYLDEKNVGGIFTKVDPKDIPDKQVFTVAGEYIGYDLQRRIVAYNKSSDKYRIMIKTYDSYNTSEDYTAGVTQLNNDIISGNMPDIIIANSMLPIDSYIAKGLVADIDELIANDEELSKNEYMDNVFEAYRVNGKLYYIIPKFTVQTVLGKKSLVGGYENWSMDDMQEALGKLPEGAVSFSSMTREYFIDMMMGYCGSSFVDVSTGKCNFNSDEFISMLEFANSLPEEYEYDEDYWNSYETQYRDNRTLLMNTSISEFSDINYQVNGYFGGDVAYVGFPTGDGQGTVISYDDAYLISAKSSCIEGAWDFMRYYLTEEYQTSDELWGLPVLKSAVSAKAQKATQRPYWIDENGEKVEYDDYFYFGGESIVLEPLTQEQVDEAYNVIASVTKPYYYNQDVTNIIKEEAAAYFSGQKSARDVADIIQNRVQIYVNENR